jgi:hypothetical protein
LIVLLPNVSLTAAAPGAREADRGERVGQARHWREDQHADDRPGDAPAGSKHKSRADHAARAGDDQRHRGHDQRHGFPERARVNLARARVLAELIVVGRSRD